MSGDQLPVSPLPAASAISPWVMRVAGVIKFGLPEPAWVTQRPGRTDTFNSSSTGPAPVNQAAQVVDRVDRTSKITPTAQPS